MGLMRPAFLQSGANALAECLRNDLTLRIIIKETEFLFDQFGALFDGSLYRLCIHRIGVSFKGKVVDAVQKIAASSKLIFPTGATTEKHFGCAFAIREQKCFLHPSRPRNTRLLLTCGAKMLTKSATGTLSVVVKKCFLSP